MFLFDPSQVRFDRVMLRRIFSGIRSSITIIDQATNEEVTIGVPFSVVNVLRNRFPATKRLIRPVPAVIMYYNTHVVAVEQFVYDTSTIDIRTVDQFQHTPWVPTIKSAYHLVVEPKYHDDNRWYFDGRYLYQYDDGNKDIDSILSNARQISTDRHFYGVRARAFDLHAIHTLTSESIPTDRECIGFSSRNTKYVTPPLWVDLDNGRKAAAVMQGTEPGSYLFDRLDQQLGINLSFALKAAKYLGQTYGIDHIAPFNLPEAIVQLNTVNLMKLPTAIKRTYDVAIPYSHMTSWLIGLMYQERDFSKFVELCNLQRQLISHGTFFKEILDPRKVYVSANFAGKLPPKAYLTPITTTSASLVYSNG